MVRQGILSGLLLGAFSVVPAQASVVLNNTRVVYEASEREVSVKVNNNGSTPVVIQSWIDSGEVDKDPSLLKVPFILMPALTRVEAGRGQTLRLTYAAEPGSSPRESVYYLNVLEIPPKAVAEQDKNLVQVALRTRVKVFYRPKGLLGSAAEAPSQLVWSVAQVAGGWVLQCFNPGAYHVSMSEIFLQSQGKSAAVGDGMVAPGERMSLTLPERPAAGSQIKFMSIDDYGAARENTRALQF